MGPPSKIQEPDTSLGHCLSAVYKVHIILLVLKKNYVLHLKNDFN